MLRFLVAACLAATVAGPVSAQVTAAYLIRIADGKPVPGAFVQLVKSEPNVLAGNAVEGFTKLTSPPLRTARFIFATGRSRTT